MDLFLKFVEIPMCTCVRTRKAVYRRKFPQGLSIHPTQFSTRGSIKNEHSVRPPAVSAVPTPQPVICRPDSAAGDRLAGTSGAHPRGPRALQDAPLIGYGA